MFTMTRKPLTLQRIAKGIHCVGAYHPQNRNQVFHYRVFGIRGAYVVDVDCTITEDGAVRSCLRTQLGIVTTLAAGEQLINDHYNSF